ncbi:MAG: RsmE family RNA methyltransferase, partial [Pseudomonadota bacterium]
PQAAPQPLRLLFAPLKRARTEFIVEKATELGCAAIQPVITRRTRPEKLKLNRLEAIAIEAAEQCTLLSVPDVREPIDLAVALAGLSHHDVLVFCNEAAPAASPLGQLAALQAASAPGDGAPAKSALDGGASDGPGTGVPADERAYLHVLIGPEGGFDDAERAAISACRAHVCDISLGPRVMRADTAAVAALTLVSALVGDWPRAE